MKRLIFTGFLFFLALARQTAYAQGLLGTILGTVSDSSGAAVGDVNVTVKNQATNLQVGGKTQSNELYQIPNLPIGTYSVTFRSPDSKSKTTPISSCRRSGRRPSTARFTWGAVSTTVEVKGTPLLNETDPTNGYILDSHTIQETPLGTGSFTQLAILSPGVNADFPGGASSNTGLGNMAIWANGQRDSSNSFVIDGVNADNLFNGKSTSQVDSTRFTSNTGQSSTVGGESRTNVSVFDGFGQSLPSPPQESLEEIRVNTEMYDATQNAKSGAHISLIAKSGSNTFHFEAYECFQNTIFNAAAFFRNANTSIVASQKVAPLHCNRPGGTFGGPIIRDKLFFGSYQTLRISDNLAGTQTATVPQSLTDDRSAAGLAAVAQASLGVTVAQSQIDPAAVKIMNAKVGGSWFIPNPTITDPVAAKQLGYNVTVTGTPSTSKANIGTGSIDYNWAERERLTGECFIRTRRTTIRTAAAPPSMASASRWIRVRNWGRSTTRQS